MKLPITFKAQYKSFLNAVSIDATCILSSRKIIDKDTLLEDFTKQQLSEEIHQKVFCEVMQNARKLSKIIYNEIIPLLPEETQTEIDQLLTKLCFPYDLV